MKLFQELTRPWQLVLQDPKSTKKEKSEASDKLAAAQLEFELAAVKAVDPNAEPFAATRLIR